MKTKEIIVQVSLSLFNENTFELSTTNLIAKKSDVLEGSLWYHFNSKQDLVSVHTELFLDSFNKNRIHTEKSDSKELILGLFSIYEVLWDYRYIMRDSFEQFSTDNPILYKQINDINSGIDVWAKETIIHAKYLGVLIIQDEDIDSLAEISLIIGRHWLDYSMKKYPSKSNLFLRKKGINLLIKTFYPYLSEDAQTIMDSIYESD
ncbi:TetR/AcrR family transcriptional regulator [Porticoccaceae bacterium]|nr:TetR/AcrR family transcriptional regulator [bacterium]MDA8734463.1 TetR/AcrR family transcriptional regulator [Porticoccaceae bacterium]